MDPACGQSRSAMAVEGVGAWGTTLRCLLGPELARADHAAGVPGCPGSKQTLALPPAQLRSPVPRLADCVGPGRRALGDRLKEITCLDHWCQRAMDLGRSMARAVHEIGGDTRAIKTPLFHVFRPRSG